MDAPDTPTLNETTRPASSNFIDGCAHCSNSVPTRWGSNYIGPDGEHLLLCGECWDEADGLVCDVCDRLADNTYDLDVWTDTAPAEPWRWASHAVVCYECFHATEAVTQ